MATSHSFLPDDGCDCGRDLCHRRLRPISTAVQMLISDPAGHDSPTHLAAIVHWSLRYVQRVSPPPVAQRQRRQYDGAPVARLQERRSQAMPIGPALAADCALAAQTENGKGDQAWQTLAASLD